MRDPARLSDVLHQVRKSVQMCAEVLRDARFGMDNEDWPEEQDDEHDESDEIGGRLAIEWANAGYPAFYYNGGDQLQFNYEPDANAWYVGYTTNMANAIAEIHRYRNRTAGYKIGMSVNAGVLITKKVEIIFEDENVPPIRFLRDAMGGTFDIDVWRPEEVETPKFSQDRELAKWLTSEWEKRRRPHVYYEGGDVLDFKKTPTTKPTYTKTFPSFEQAIFVCRKLKHKRGFKGISIFINSNFSVTNEVSFFFYGYVPDGYTLRRAIEAY